MTLLLTAAAIAAIIRFALHEAPHHAAIEDTDWGQAEHIGTHGNTAPAAAERQGLRDSADWPSFQYPG